MPIPCPFLRQCNDRGLVLRVLTPEILSILALMPRANRAFARELFSLYRVLPIIYVNDIWQLRTIWIVFLAKYSAKEPGRTPVNSSGSNMRAFQVLSNRTPDFAPAAFKSNANHLARTPEAVKGSLEAVVHRVLAVSNSARIPFNTNTWFSITGASGSSAYIIWSRSELFREQI